MNGKFNWCTLGNTEGFYECMSDGCDWSSDTGHGQDELLFQAARHFEDCHKGTAVTGLGTVIEALDALVAGCTVGGNLHDFWESPGEEIIKAGFGQFYADKIAHLEGHRAQLMEDAHGLRAEILRQDKQLGRLAVERDEARAEIPAAHAAGVAEGVAKVKAAVEPALLMGGQTPLIRCNAAINALAAVEGDAS